MTQHRDTKTATTWESPRVTILKAEELDRDSLRILASGSDPLKSSDVGKGTEDEEY